MKNKSRLLKKRYVLSVLSVALLVWFSNSFQFRMSDLAVDTYFRGGVVPQIRYMKTDLGKIRFLYQNNGHNTTVVFVHGAPGSSSAFIDFFNNENLRSKVNLLSLDRPGYGYSDFGQPMPALTDQAQVLNHLISANDWGNVLLVGHSLGVPVIAQAAFSQPELYQGMVMVAGSVDPDLEPMEWYRPWLTNGLARWILPATLYVTNEEIYRLRGQLSQLASRWASCHTPVVVIHGTEDILVPKENVAFIQNRISPEYLEVWLEQDVNHFIPWNRPDLIEHAILKLAEKL